MILRARLRDPRVMLRVAMSFYLISAALRWFVHLAPGISQDLLDAANGFLFGLAIALSLEWVWMNGRRSRGGEAGPCASR